eukprot:CAMPEP_0198433486 /NCGR_PEP_ID=MMETSP1452-20131203/26788_1 /TAXON_ID=1181717 /ORGANISM="Synchroma pusillum, Strain CCMP3072" /LENGTH=209 /DNA_ID=CAMNT_0044153981 /DNA_START=6 /DNA_END=631 /DNA_ORIENTATION=-
MHGGDDSFVRLFASQLTDVPRQLRTSLHTILSLDERSRTLDDEVWAAQRDILSGATPGPEALESLKRKRQELHGLLRQKQDVASTAYKNLDGHFPSIDRKVACLDELIGSMGEPEDAQAKKAKAGAARGGAPVVVGADGLALAPEDEQLQPKYCYCQRVSFGTMIGCDGEDCKNEWFHLECLHARGVKYKTEADFPDAWLCDECSKLQG